MNLLYFLGVIGIALLVGLAVWVHIKLFRMYFSPNGERYQRLRAQGPFVPLSPEEIADDRARVNASRDKSSN